MLVIRRKIISVQGITFQIILIIIIVIHSLVNLFLGYSLPDQIQRLQDKNKNCFKMTHDSITPELETKEDFLARNGVSSCWFGSMKRRFTAETLQISKVSESLLAA